MRHLTLALAGNPNTGKTSIFNALTGARQHTGNWPGKTVLKLQGVCAHNGVEITVVDLPGTYSISAISPEEVVARDYLLSGEADAALVVLDAANLERNLFLAVQLLEAHIPAVIALNMIDVAQRRGDVIDHQRLAHYLGVPVVPTIARLGEGIRQLKEALIGLPARRLVS